MCGNNNCDCLRDVLCMIVKLQKQGECIDDNINSCDRPFLGINNNTAFNTRPITLYTCPNNKLWTMPIDENTEGETSSIFRIEAVEGCCATFRILKNENTNLVATNSFFTINLKCVGAIQCLDDVFIACI